MQGSCSEQRQLTINPERRQEGPVLNLQGALVWLQRIGNSVPTPSSVKMETVTIGRAADAFGSVTMC